MEPRPGAKPDKFLLLIESVMTRCSAAGCGKWPGSVRADPGCAIESDLRGVRKPVALTIFKTANWRIFDQDALQNLDRAAFISGGQASRRSRI